MKNKNVLVTGCSRGLGIEITKKLLLQGANVYGISRSLNPAVIKLQSEFSGSFKYISFDFQCPEEIKEKIFMKWIGNKIPLHGFVNNAAVAYDDIATNLNIDQLNNMFRVNVYSPYVLTKYVIRNMLLFRTPGSLVHSSSISVHTGYKGLSMYAGSKGAIEGFSKNISREWGERNIRSNCIVAGFMDTDMSASLTGDQKARIFQRNALKRETSPQSIASTACFLLSGDSGSITGQNVFVDSGTI